MNLLLQILFACLASVAFCAPQGFNDQDAQVIQDERVAPDEFGNFNNVLEVDNGIYSEALGEPGIEGQVNMRGSYR